MSALTVDTGIPGWGSAVVVLEVGVESRERGRHGCPEQGPLWSILWWPLAPVLSLAP